MNDADGWFLISSHLL